jgi:hypothetical protein
VARAAPSLFSYRRLAGGKYALLLPSRHVFAKRFESVSFMITLWAGSLPPALARLPDAQLQHLAVFSSRSREEGRERFRLHLGYFDDLSAAERTLRRVRQWYPSAWAVPAERHAALARLPALVAPASSPPVPPVPPVPLSMHDSVDRLVAAPSSLTPRETLTLLEEPAAPEPAAVHMFRGDCGHVRLPFEVSEWQPAAPKSPGKPKARSWLKRLTA